MTVFLLLLLSLCAWGVLHTYVTYPWRMLRWARTQVPEKLGEQPLLPIAARQSPSATYPTVYVLMAAHNEEAVLEAKLVSLFAQDYPGRLLFLVGSDNSTDRTNDILTRRARQDKRLRPTLFTSRQGKPAIVNQLAASVTTDDAAVFLMTDASVMLRPDTIRLLVGPLLADAGLGIVDATMRQVGARRAGIGAAEVAYIDREVLLKRAEGRRWGAMIGPFGGCFALRATAFQPVPDRFLVDDFFLCMGAYEQGFRGVSSAEAVVEEAVGQSLGAEFRRKVRISSGNWQNLVRFRHLWWPFWKNPLAYAFFSHKVLRWWTPFFLLGGLGALWGLAQSYRPAGNYLVWLLFECALWVVVLVPLLDLLLSRLGIHLGPLRKARYFLAMNAALLVGFWRYLTGISSNVWQPSERH